MNRTRFCWNFKGLLFSITLTFLQHKQYSQGVPCWNTNSAFHEDSAFPTACFCYFFLAKRVDLIARVEKGFQALTRDTANCSGFSSPKLREKVFPSFNTLDAQIKDESLEKTVSEDRLGTVLVFKVLRDQGVTRCEHLPPCATAHLLLLLFTHGWGKATDHSERCPRGDACLPLKAGAEP